MSHKLKSNQMRILLPWYANGTLQPSEKQMVEEWLLQDPSAQAELAELRRMRQDIKNRPQIPTPAGSFYGVTARIQAKPRLPWWAVSRWVSLSMGTVLTLAILIILWMVVRPGVVLQWSVSESSLSTFRIYRAPMGSQDYKLLSEVPLEENVLQYSFVDAWLVPGQDYVYRVEGVEQGQFLAVSQSIVTSSMVALPGQLAILFTSLVLGYTGLTLIRAIPLFLPNQKPGVMAR